MEGDQMKMRDALVNIAGYAETARCHTEDAHVLGYLEQIEKWANEAISALPRQCDVGTAEEQVRRYKLFCENHSCWDGQKRFGCQNCPFIDEDECEFAWAQMPYEAQEGGAE